MKEKISKDKIIWLLIFVAAIAVAIGLDQLTKYIVVKNMELHSSIPLINGVLELYHIQNTGIAWSLLSGQMFFILFSGVAFMAVILFFIWKLPVAKKFRIVYIVCGFLCGGAIGNMIDRIRLKYVIDFIYFKIINFPIFNVADIFIVVSVMILAIMFIFVYKEDDLTFLSLKSKKYREVK